MSNKSTKPYAISVFVKPTPTCYGKYKGVSFKGVVLAPNPSKATEAAINKVLEAFAEYDGSSELRPVVTRENVVVRKCELFGDFITQV